nr:U32 family peptidase [uncultured Clostridium sp.]
MNYYSIPADFKKSTIDKYEELNQKYNHSKVLETYGQATVSNHFGSGRTIDSLPAIDLFKLEDYVKYSKSKGIGFNYTFNSIHMNNNEFTEAGIKEIQDYLHELADIGIDSITVTLPPLFEIIKGTGVDFKIKTSTICQINNANKAMAYKNLGAERIVIEESVNRKFDTLKNITDVFGDKVEIIVNAVCNQDCIYRTFHYNEIATDSVKVTNKASIQYYNNRCMLRRHGEMGNIMKMSWVRPEDIEYYNAVGIHYFKLQGRHNVIKGDPVRAVECYFKASFDGNLMHLIDLFAPTNSFDVYVDNKKLDGFIKPYTLSDRFCNSNCSSCNHCELFAEKAITSVDAKEVLKKSTRFYTESDIFTKMIKDTERTEVNSIQVEVEFDI